MKSTPPVKTEAELRELNPQEQYAATLRTLDLSTIIESHYNVLREEQARLFAMLEPINRRLDVVRLELERRANETGQAMLPHPHYRVLFGRPKPVQARYDDILFSVRDLEIDGVRLIDLEPDLVNEAARIEPQEPKRVTNIPALRALAKVVGKPVEDILAKGYPEPQEQPYRLVGIDERKSKGDEVA